MHYHVPGQAESVLKPSFKSALSKHVRSRSTSTTYTQQTHKGEEGRGQNRISNNMLREGLLGIHLGSSDQNHYETACICFTPLMGQEILLALPCCSELTVLSNFRGKPMSFQLLPHEKIIQNLPNKRVS